MQLSHKQKEFWNEPFHRWNIKYGATRSGKTYFDYFMIARRIRERTGKAGLVVLLGNTQGTLQRNVIEPMQQIYGANLVSNIRSNNTAILFGEKVYCLGADNKKHVDRIRGASIKYCYGDEITTWNEEVFTMLKSRLDKPYSCFDGTCNPKSPKHWVYKFINSDADVFSQQYSLDDNPFLDAKVKEELKKEHTGVFYDRYILGLWVAAEGLVFPEFASNTKANIITKDRLPNRFLRCEVGFDIGGNKSAYALTCTAQGYDGNLYVLKSKKTQADKLTMDSVERLAEQFCRYITNKYGQRTDVINCDHVDVVINSINDNTSFYATKAFKPPVAERPILFTKLLGAKKLLFVDGECDDLIDELSELVFDSKRDDTVPLDDGTMQIDAYDSLTYSISSDWHYLSDIKKEK